MKMKIACLLFAILAQMFFDVPTAVARSQAAKELVKQFRITTYTASRKGDNLFELLEGYVVKTRYCFVYVYFGDVVIINNKIIFIDDDEVCDVEGVYRK